MTGIQVLIEVPRKEQRTYGVTDPKGGFTSFKGLLGVELDDTNDALVSFPVRILMTKKIR